MAKILMLNTELTLTYSWSSVNHGICGHTYEVIEYYFILKDHFDVGILLCEDITPETFRTAIEDKYSFDSCQIDNILDNTRFVNRPSLLKGKNILFTDGGIRSTKKLTLLFNNILHFACGDKEVQGNTRHNTHILQDDRVYETVTLNGINYKKKVLFDHLKKIGKSDNNNLVYVTKNCRDIETDVFKELEDTYDGNFIYLGTDEKYTSPRFKYLQMPAKDLFTKFDTYIYTEVPRHFDCSPRFIAECHWYNKDVIYHKIFYLNEDLGLKWRRYDIENDFNSISLKHNDEIITILKGIIRD